MSHHAAGLEQTAELLKFSNGSSEMLDDVV